MLPEPNGLRHDPAPASGTTSLVTGAWCLLAGAIGAPILVIAATPDAAGHAWLGAGAVMGLAAARLAVILAAGRPRLVEANIWLFVYVFLGIAPLAQLRADLEPGTTPGIVDAFHGRSVLIILLGCLGILIGSRLYRRRGAAEPQTAPGRELSRRRCILLAVAAIMFAALYVARLGPGPLFDSRAAMSKALTVAWPDSTVRVVIQAAVAMSLLVALVSLLMLRQRARQDWLVSVLLPVLVGSVLFLVVNPLSSPRYLVGTTMLSTLACLGFFSTRRRFRFIMISALIAFTLLFPYADFFRHSGGADARSLQSPVVALSDGDYDAFAQINNTALYVEREGITYGRQALGVALFWVPRSAWPDKPVDTGILLAEFRDYSFTNLSAPLWAELYINGGWGLLVAGMVGLGWGARRADESIAVTLLRGRLPAPVWCILPFYLLLVLRGSLLQSMAYLSVVLLCVTFVTSRRRPEHPAPGAKAASQAGEVRERA